MGTSTRPSSRVLRRYARRRLRRRAVRRRMVGLHTWWRGLFRWLVPDRAAPTPDAEIADFFNYDIDHRNDARRVGLLAPATRPSRDSRG